MVISMDASSETTMSSSPVGNPSTDLAVQQGETTAAKLDEQNNYENVQAATTASEQEKAQEGKRGNEEEEEASKQVGNPDEPMAMVVSCCSSINEARTSKQIMSADTEVCSEDRNVALSSSGTTLIYSTSGQKSVDASKDSLVARMRDIVEGGGQRNVEQPKQQPKSSSDSLNNNNENISKASVDSAQQKRARHLRAHHHCRHHHHHVHRHRPSVGESSGGVGPLGAINASNNEDVTSTATTGANQASCSSAHNHHHHRHHHRHHHHDNEQHSTSAHHHRRHNHHNHHHHHHHRQHHIHQPHIADGDTTKGTTSKRNSIHRQSVAQIDSLEASNTSVNAKQTGTNESSSSTSSTSAIKVHDQKLGQTINPDQENLENKPEQDSSNSIKPQKGELSNNNQDEQKAISGMRHHHYHQAAHHHHHHPHPHQHPHSHPYHHHHHHHCHHRNHKKRLVLDVGNNKPAAIVKSGAENQEISDITTNDEHQPNLDGTNKREPFQELTSQSNLSSCCSHNEANLCSAHQSQLKSGSKQQQHSHHSHPHPHHHHHHHHHHHNHHLHSSTTSTQQQEQATVGGDEATASGRTNPNHHYHHHRHNRHHHHHHGGASGQTHKQQRHRNKQKSSSKTNINDFTCEGRAAASNEGQKETLVKQMSTDEPKVECQKTQSEPKEATVTSNTTTGDNKIIETNMAKSNALTSASVVVQAKESSSNDNNNNNEVIRMETSPNNEARLSRAGDEFVDSTASDSNLITSIEIVPTTSNRQLDKLTKDAPKQQNELHSRLEAQQSLQGKQTTTDVKPGVSMGKEQENTYIKDDFSDKSNELVRRISSNDDSKKNNQRGDGGSQSGGSGDNGKASSCGRSGRELQQNSIAEVSSHRQSVTYQASMSQPKQLTLATNTSSMPTDKRCKLCWCCCCPCSALSVRTTTARPEISKPSSGSPQSNSPSNKCSSPPNVSIDEIRSWADSFDRLMKCNDGRKIFQDFLRCEYSEENILFWTACEQLKAEKDSKNIATKARDIYEDYISILSSKEVSLDSRVRDIINNSIKKPTSNIFDEAQLQIYTLMHRDSYPRFINSAMYKKLAQLPSSSRKSSS